jgi:glycosyltransferase involved in cell wall biosynthesis
MSVNYSILVPTWNKLEYLKHTVDSIVNQDYENFELIISDDFSTDGTSDYLALLKDKRIKVVKPPFKLTQAKNYEFILSHATGEWISIIGDDDGVLPDFFKTLDKTIEKLDSKIEAISSKPAFYYWESVNDLYGERVVDYQNFFEKNKIISSKKNLFYALLGWKDRTDLPMIYTSGLIKKTLIDRIKNKSNNFFFHSIVPDYYSMVAILFETNKFLRLNQPIFWVGASSKSTGKGLRIYQDNIEEKKDYFVNKNLFLSKDINNSLHRTGIAPIYFYECILKHPYISNFWRSKFIKNLVLISSLIYFKNKLMEQPWRIKTNISFIEFKKIITKELSSSYFVKFLYIPIYLIVYLGQKFFKNFLIKIEKYINYFKKKVIKSKNIVLVSNDRKKYSSINECNTVINLLNNYKI